MPVGYGRQNAVAGPVTRTGGWAFQPMRDNDPSTENDSDVFRALVAAATARQGQRLIITDADDADDAQASGRWLAAAEPVEVRR